VEPTDPKEVQKHLTVTDLEARGIALAWDNHLDALRLLNHSHGTPFEIFIVAYHYGWTVGVLQKQLMDSGRITRQEGEEGVKG